MSETNRPARGTRTLAIVLLTLAVVLVVLFLPLFPWLAAAGPLSVLYWILTEQAGAGDLRFYGLVHFYPMALIPLLLWLFPPRHIRGRDVLVVLALYGAALGAQWLDRQIFSLGGWVSGHTAKHLLAAWWVWRMLRLRRPAPDAGHPSCTRAS